MTPDAPPPSGLPASDSLHTFWTLTRDALCSELRCGIDGLSSEHARHRLSQYGPNSDVETKADNLARALLRRLLEPLSLILLVAGVVSVVTGDTIGGSIIVAILAISIGLDTVQEGHAAKAAEVLRRSVALKVEVKRDRAIREVVLAQVVTGTKSRFDVMGRC